MDLEKIDSKDVTRKLLLRVFKQFNDELGEYARRTRETPRIRELEEAMSICRGHIHYILQEKELDVEQLLSMSNYLQEWMLSFQLNPVTTPHSKRMNNN